MMIPSGSAAQDVLIAMARELHEAGYWREADERREDGYIALMAAFRRMSEDAQKQRARPTAASGKADALSFLRATMEDAQKPMAERMEAARMLLMHSAEGK